MWGELWSELGYRRLRLERCPVWETRQGEKCDFLGTECASISDNNEGHYKVKEGHRIWEFIGPLRKCVNLWPLRKAVVPKG